MLVSKRLVIRPCIRPASSSSSCANSSSDLKIVTLEEMKRFIVDCLETAGASRCNAEQHASVLVEADRRGISGHGINRLHMYVKDLKKGLCDGCAEPKILSETESTAWVDGSNTFGSVVGKFCMDLAVNKAKCTGVGVVIARNSNHYGMGATYVLRALEADLIGLCLTNTSPLVVPTRAKDSVLGTNPISFAAPANEGDSLVLDIATSVVSFGKIEVYNMKNLPLQNDWALDEDGNPTSDASVALKAKRLLPLGGNEFTSGYKGYGISLMIEVLCGILSHSNYGPHIPDMMNHDNVLNLGHFFLALDPERFAPDFKTRLGCFLGLLRTLEPTDTQFPVSVPGDAEKKALETTDERGGVEFTGLMLDNFQKLADSLKIKPLKY